MVTRSGKKLEASNPTKPQRRGKDTNKDKSKNKEQEPHQQSQSQSQEHAHEHENEEPQHNNHASENNNTNPSQPTLGKLVTPIIMKSQDIPSSASIRPWRTPRAQKTSLQVQSRVKKSFDKRMEEREKKAALLARIRDMQEAQLREKREERERLKAKRERREANVAKANMGKVQVVKNASKIKKMNRKQRASLGMADVT